MTRLLDIWFDATQIYQRSSFSQWLLGVALTILAGLLLYNFGDSKPVSGSERSANANACLEAAGSDLKRGELMYHDMATRPCGCTAVN
jgi:hypothetical protein